MKNIQSYVASEVLSEEGKILGKYYWENRSTVAFEEIPPVVVEALIATEDARFYEHNGVDAIGLMRVFFKTLLMGDKSSGGEVQSDNSWPKICLNVKITVCSVCQ